MKKWIALLVFMACAVTGAGAQVARVQPVTLSELKRQMPERLQMTVTTKDGDTIAVDAPVYLPDADTMPVILVQRATFDTTALHDVFPFPKYYSQEYSKGELQSMLDDDHPGSLSLWLYAEEKRYLLYGVAAGRTRDYLPLGEAPPENGVTVDEIMAFIGENIRRFGCDTQPDLRVIKANAMTGQYGTKKFKTPEGWTEETIDTKNPVKNGSKGLWYLDLAQYMHNIRIFGDYLPYGSYLTPENSHDWYSPIDLYVRYLDDQSFNVGLLFVKEAGILTEDAPLLSYDSLVEALQNRMREGKLHSIYQLSLGYSVKIVKGDSFYNDADTGFNPDTRYVLVPEWEILGFDEKNVNDAKSVGLDAPTREMVLEPERYSRYGLTYDVRMNASTGDFILDEAATEYDLGD